MLSYRHAFHAGNHADCLKHLILTRLLTHLTAKDKALCYCETHAGPGLYALDSPQAQQNQEYLGGIGRLWGRRDLPPGLTAYLALVQACNGPGPLRRYPGSPWLAQRLLRPGDRLILHELHGAETGPLRGNFAGDRRIRVVEGDGFRGLIASLPPRERRGLTLIDPAYEVKTDCQQVVETLTEAHRRFATGVYALWYPVVERGRIDALERHLTRSGIRRVQRYELAVRNEARGPGLAASGMLVVNPPWTLLDDLSPEMEALASALGEGGAGRFRAEQLIGD